MKRLSHNNAPQNDEAWDTEVKGIKRLPPVEEPPSKPLIIEPCRKHIDYQKAYRGSSLEPLTHGSTANIDRRTAEKFKRGEFKIEKSLDLHGMTESVAYDAVEEFIKNAYLQKLRCVIIVTGKGLHKEDDIWFERRGILRELVPQWLNAPALRPLILSFSYAQPADGGEGALYVLLRRAK